jgi:hypothetical protein
MLDIAISAALAVLTIAMAYLGIHVTLHPPNESSKARLLYKTGFFVCGCFMVCLVIAQSTRGKQAQRSAGNQIDGLKNDIRDAKQAVVNESQRRQKAEADLKLAVTSSGQETRSGITQDLRKTPLKVDVTQKPADTPEKLRIRGDLGEFARRGMEIRDKLATDVPLKQVEDEGQEWFVEVQSYLKKNLEPSFLNQFLLTHPELSPSVVPSEKLPVWHGLNERIQTLDRFIDELK